MRAAAEWPRFNSAWAASSSFLAERAAASGVGFCYCFGRPPKAAGGAVGRPDPAERPGEDRPEDDRPPEDERPPGSGEVVSAGAGGFSGTSAGPPPSATEDSSAASVAVAGGDSSGAAFPVLSADGAEGSGAGGVGSDCGEGVSAVVFGTGCRREQPVAASRASAKQSVEIQPRREIILRGSS